MLCLFSTNVCLHTQLHQWSFVHIHSIPEMCMVNSLSCIICSPAINDSKGLVDGPDPQEAHIVGHTLMVGIWEHGFWVVPIGVYHALKVFFRALFFAVGVTSGHLCG